MFTRNSTAHLGKRTAGKAEWSVKVALQNAQCSGKLLHSGEKLSNTVNILLSAVE